MTEQEYYIWLRNKKGITQQEVADALGVTKPTIHYYEVGKTKMRYNRETQYKKYIEEK